MTDDHLLPARSDVGLLLIGHGSRDAQAVDEFLQTAHRVASRAGPWAVEPCFLEFAVPSIAEGFSRLAAAGVRHIVVAPVMLFAAGHIRRDIPREVIQAAARFPRVTHTQAEHLGTHPAIIELSQSRYDESFAGDFSVPPRQTVLVMVGRGSHDKEATREMLRVTQLRRQATRVADARTAFLAMTAPRLEQVLDEVAHTAVRRVVVQPHLLFAGELYGRIRSTVEGYASDFAHVDWRLTTHLRPAEPLVTAILERASAALPMQAHRG